MEKRHIQLRMDEPLAEAVRTYATAHGGITFTAAVYVLLARALRAEGFMGETREHDSQDA